MGPGGSYARNTHGKKIENCAGVKPLDTVNSKRTPNCLALISFNFSNGLGPGGRRNVVSIYAHHFSVSTDL